MKRQKWLRAIMAAMMGTVCASGCSAWDITFAAFDLTGAIIDAVD